MITLLADIGAPAGRWAEKGSATRRAFRAISVEMRKKISIWRVHPGRARADALDLIGEHGPLAYAVASRMARSERVGRPPLAWLPRGHWERVRHEVKRSASAVRRTAP